jgi:hypothetical protein
VEAEGFGGGGMVAPAFGDVQVAGVFEGRDDGGADRGRVGGPAAGPAGGGVFDETYVADVVVRLDSGVNGPNSSLRTIHGGAPTTWSLA